MTTASPMGAPAPGASPPPPTGPGANPGVVAPTTSPPLPPYDLPAPPWSAAVGAAKAIVIVYLLVIVPLQLIAVVETLISLTLPLNDNILIFGGAGIAITSGLSTALRTTQLYGVMRFISYLVKLAYLLLLAIVGTLSLSVASATIRFGFAPMVYLFMIGSALAAASALVTTVEDFLRPKERFPFDFPRKRLRSMARGSDLPPTA